MPVRLEVVEKENHPVDIIEQRTKTKNYNILQKEFWILYFTKLAETAISVKVWGLVTITVLATYLLTHGYISGSEWATVIGTVYSVIYGMREIFKIANINQYNNDNSE